MGLGNFFYNLLIARADKAEGDFQSYHKRIATGSFRDRFVYGIADDKRGFHTLDPVKSPGALYCGGMGSGKSVAMRFTVATHLVSNSDHTLYILVDPEKGMTDYADLFKYDKNVVTALNDPAKVVPVIDMVYEEAMKRKEIFSQDDIQANNIYAYEKITGKKIARIVICFEEFHSIPNSKYINFAMKYEKPGTVANKLKVLMRVGRSYGITVLAATQRATSEDFPTTLKPGISQMMAFRTKNPGDASVINLPHAADIRSEQVGRCAYEGGFIQFPWLPSDTIEKLLKKYYKPLNAELFAYQVEDYHSALSGEGNDGMVEVKPLMEILENREQFNINAVTQRFLSLFDYKMLPQENSAMAISMLAEKDGKKIAIMILEGRRSSSGSKKIEAFLDGARILKCNRALVVGYEGIPSGISPEKLKLDEEALIVDYEDLERIAQVMDNEEKLKQAGKFDELYQKLVLVEKQKEEENEEEPEVSSEVDALLQAFNEASDSEKKNLKD